ncbi:MAG: hypothetical protein ACK4TP_06880 [Hyphomicrobium sp.]|jgi:hypothetical protein
MRVEIEPTTEGAFEWQIQPTAATIAHRLVREFCARSTAARQLRGRMLRETGTRFYDWVDFLAPPRDTLERKGLVEAGFAFSVQDGRQVAEHPGGAFPTIQLDGRGWSLGVKVESVADYLHSNGIGDAKVEGAPYAALRMARVAREADAELWVVERHGQVGFTPHAVSMAEASAVLRHAEAFRCRRRRFERDEDGFDHALKLIGAAVADLGTGRASDLFFAAEREYWQSRNRAGRLQKARQDRLGLGWGNHDHHTYRSSREHFAGLIRVLEALGLACRERFYAGIEAGWGAQLLEHPASRIVVFADVDLPPDEVSGDFAHSELPPRRTLGTIGLWCKLHGEALLQAGMHHLEAQFDFDAARAQLEREGVPTMEPFTDLTFLRQAFTLGEIWPLDPRRLAAAREAGFITDVQAERFSENGALGSHMEILERNDGYKGFNKTGISQIINRTDPRRKTVAA